MSKGYVKDSNRNYRLVDKETQKNEEGTPETKAWVKEIMEGPIIKDLDERLKKVEEMLFGNTK